MSFIADNFDATVVAIKAKIAAGEKPTQDIISFILRDQCHKAQGLLRKDSGGLTHSLCINGFSMVGWDFNGNKAYGPSPPTIEKVESMLTATATKIRTTLEEVNATLVPSAEELKDLALAADRLWQLDINRLTPENGDYEIDLQEGKRYGDSTKVADERLFKHVQRELLRRPTFSAFLALLNNYNAKVGEKETFTAQNKAEIARFLDSVLATPVMKYCHKFLVAKNLAPADVVQYRQQLYEIWFQPYNRTRGVKDSSGFEHVFIGEISGDPPKVVGFHNWLKLYVEERLRRFDYKGYIKPRVKGGRVADPMNTEQLIAVNFTWQGVEKESSTIFIGVSPEMELALYTMCFLAGNDVKQVVKLGPYFAEITCHSYNVEKGKKAVGTSYPGQATDHQAAGKIQAAFRGLSAKRIYDKK